MYLQASLSLIESVFIELNREIVFYFLHKFVVELLEMWPWLEKVKIITLGKRFTMWRVGYLVDIFRNNLIDELVGFFSCDPLTGMPQLACELHIHRGASVCNFRFPWMNILYP
jgi:hypothetical protein